MTTKAFEDNGTSGGSEDVSAQAKTRGDLALPAPIKPWKRCERKSPANPGDGDSPISSYCVIRFKCPVFNKNITRHTKTGTFQREKISMENVPERQEQIHWTKTF